MNTSHPNDTTSYHAAHRKTLPARSSIQRHNSHDHSLLHTSSIADQFLGGKGPLKRASSISSDHPFPGRESVYAPQLSERDSIFATHYLPSDPDSNTVPPKGVVNALKSNETTNPEDYSTSASGPPTPKAQVDVQIPPPPSRFCFRAL